MRTGLKIEIEGRKENLDVSRELPLLDTWPIRFYLFFFLRTASKIRIAIMLLYSSRCYIARLLEHILRLGKQARNSALEREPSTLSFGAICLVRFSIFRDNAKKIYIKKNHSFVVRVFEDRDLEYSEIAEFLLPRHADNREVSLFFIAFARDIRNCALCKHRGIRI